MGRRSRSGVIPVLLALVFAQTSIAASGALVGEGWVLLELDVVDPTVLVVVEFEWVGPTSAVIMALRPDGTAEGEVGGIGISGEVVNVGAAGSEVGTSLVRFPGIAGVVRGFPASGTYRIPILVGGGVREWSYWIETRGEASYTIRELARGDTVHSLEPRDFGPLGVDARVLGAQAFAGRGTYPIEIEHELIGIADTAELLNYVAGPHVSSGVSVSGPNGTRECPCRFRDPFSPALGAAGPGHYDVNLDGQGVRAIHGPLVLVADIEVFG